MKKDTKGRKLRDGESQAKSGIYRYRWTDAAGIRHEVRSWRLTDTDITPPNKAYCEPLRRMETDAQKQEYERKSSIPTVMEWIQDYTDGLSGITNSTRASYESFIANHIKTARIANLKLSEVSSVAVRRYYRELSETLSASTVTAIHSGILSPAFALAVQDGLIVRNPCAGALKSVSAGKDSAKHRNALSRESESKLTAYLSENREYYGTLILFLLNTGLRIGEAAGLKWDSLELKTGQVTVCGQMVYDKLKRQYVETLTKTGDIRTVPLTPEVTAMMQAHRDKHRFTQEYVFVSKSGKCICSSAVSRNFKSIAEQAGIEPFTPHVLRHTYITRMIQSGLSPSVVQRLAGHKSISITLSVYTHISCEDAVRAVREMQAAGC